MTGRGLASNAAYLGALTLSNYALGLLIFPYLSRVLSVEVFGVFGFSMTFVVVFQVVVEFGFMISATAKIARHRDDSGRVGNIVATTMLAKAMLASVAVMGLFTASLLIPMVREHFIVVALFFLSALLTAMMPDFYFRGVERMRSIAVRAVVSKSVALMLIVALVHSDDQLPIVPAALAAGNLLAVLLAFQAIRRDGVVLTRPRFADAISSVREGASFFGSRVAASVNQMAGTFLLGLQFAPASTAMGQFTGASRISSAGELAVIPISDAIYPHMVRSRDYKLFRRVFAYGFAVWFVGCVAVFAWAEPLCVILLGAKFADAGELLRILVVGAFFAYSSNLFGYPALTPLGLAHHANIALIISAGLNVVVYGILWATDVITPWSICAVMASTNLVVFAYRFGVFALHWRGSHASEQD